MPGQLTKPSARERLAALGLPPRGLPIDEAAAYVGLSPELFQRQVKEGIYPKPLEDGRRRTWDRVALDEAMNKRSGLKAAPDRANLQAEMLAAIDGDL